MPTVDQQIDFATKNIRDKTGRKWTAKGRDWIRDEFFTPVDGWKMWPRSETDPLCDTCSENAGQVVEHLEHGQELTQQCKADKCGGLKIEPIIMTVLCLPRRSGKTFNTAAYCLSQILQHHHKRIAFICSSEDQMRALFRENYAAIIKQNPKIAKAVEVFEHRGTIKVPKTNSLFEGMSTSHGSVTGRGRTLVVVDEARDVPGRTMMALLPSIYEASGVECPRGHIHVPKTADTPKICPVCRSKLQPWYGRILLMSSAGIIESGSGEKDWFPELVEHLRKNPQPNVHLYESERNLNPDVSDVITGTVENVFGSLESTRSYVAVEVNNRFTRKGENLLIKSQIDRVVDTGLRNKITSSENAVAFLDTSKTHDLTSLVILSEDPERSPEPWGHVVVSRIDIWDPKKLPGGVINPVDILEHLDLYLPMFPNLKTLRVDTRVMPWAVALVRKCKKEKAYGRIVEGWNKQRAERKSAWSILLQRILEGTIRIPNLDQLRQELLSVRKVTDLDGQMDIRDASRRKRHVDVADALATCCYLAHLESINTSTGLSVVVRESKARDILSALYRPVSESIELDRF